jgi:hypothetical protein
MLQPGQAKDIIIAVGGKPQRLPIPGAELAITSDETLELETRPNKVSEAACSCGGMDAARNVRALVRLWLHADAFAHAFFSCV